MFRCYSVHYEKKGFNIAVVPRAFTQFAFTTLCQSLDERGLSINDDKLLPLIRHLTCLWIDILIDRNTLDIQSDKITETDVCIGVAILKKNINLYFGKNVLGQRGHL